MRIAIALVGCVALLSAVGCSSDDDTSGASDTTAASTAAPTTTRPPIPGTAPEVIGPIEDGSRSNAFAAAAIDVEAAGYVEEEYFLDGAAQAYDLAPGAEYATDGHWDIVPARTAPFRTRILVLRPVDPAEFSGNVVVTWLNVTAGFEINGVTERQLEDGDAFVALSAQKVGLEGFPGFEENGLRAWDPERYGSLHHPGDDFSFDLLTKTAQVVGPGRGAIEPDPMGGLDVQHVIATGASQSAARINAYINGVQPLTHAFDGFLSVVGAGTASAFHGENPILGTLLAGIEIRDDVDVPVINLSSETEADALYRVRQPDTDTFRTWEVAGAAHSGGGGGDDDLTSAFERDGLSVPAGFGADGGSGPLPNQVSYAPMAAAARAHLLAWAAGAGPPPSMPLIEFADGEIARDGYGNALGGIRPPELEVPVATYSGHAGTGNPLADLSGSTIPFSPARIHELYPTEEVYLDAYAEAVQRGVDAGYLLEQDADEVYAAGQERAQELFS